MKVKAIFSDAGGILFDDLPEKNRYYNFLKQHVAVSKEEFNKDFNKYKEQAMTQKDYSSDDAFRDYLAANSLEHLYDKFLQQPGTKIELYKGVIQTINELNAKGIRFIVLTDSTKDGGELEKTLVELGIENVDVISSVDVGAKKPAKKFWEYALEKYGLTKEEVAFLGHSLDELQGASEYGFNTAALNYDENDDLQFIPLKQKLSTFSELPELIAQD